MSAGTRLATRRLTNAARWAIAGPTWTRMRPTGDGLGTTRSMTTTTGIGPLWLLVVRPLSVTASVPGTPMQVTTYHLIGPPTVDVAVGDRLISAAGAVVLTTAPDRSTGILRAIVSYEETSDA